MLMTYLTRDGDVLDAICAAQYGVENTAAAVVAVLEANRGLADRGAVYDAGLTIILPEFTPPTVDSPLQLWD